MARFIGMQVLWVTGLTNCGHSVPVTTLEPAPLGVTASAPCGHLTLSLPYPRGVSHRVLQTFGDQGSHTGADRYAVDFAMAQGDTVVAAQSGIVVESIDTFEWGGSDPALKDKANVIVIDHGGACFSVYQHLARGSARVHEGEAVLQGQAIGQAGNTGWSTVPHLHFEVIDIYNQSVPFRFEELGSQTMQSDRAYVSQNAASIPSPLPHDAFAINGIILESDAPSRLFTGSTATFVGHLSQPGRHVVAFLFARSGGPTIRHALSALSETGRFRLALDLRGLNDSYNFAIAIVDENGGYKSDFSIPVVVRSEKLASEKVASEEIRTQEVGSKDGL